MTPTPITTAHSYFQPVKDSKALPAAKNCANTYANKNTVAMIEPTILTAGLLKRFSKYSIGDIAPWISYFRLIIFLIIVKLIIHLLAISITYIMAYTLCLIVNP